MPTSDELQPETRALDTSETIPTDAALHTRNTKAANDETTISIITATTSQAMNGTNPEAGTGSDPSTDTGNGSTKDTASDLTNPHSSSPAVVPELNPAGGGEVQQLEYRTSEERAGAATAEKAESISAGATAAAVAAVEVPLVDDTGKVKGEMTEKEMRIVRSFCPFLSVYFRLAPTTW